MSTVPICVTIHLGDNIVEGEAKGDFEIIERFECGNVMVFKFGL